MLGAAGILVAGCGDTDGDSSATEDGPLTSRAVAAVMLDHLSDGTTHRQATYIDEHSPPGLVGADFRYKGGGEYDGDLVRVTVVPGKPYPCDPSSHCTDLGDGVTLRWGLQVPEEDPGSVSLQRRRGDEVVTVYFAGPDHHRRSARPRPVALARRAGGRGARPTAEPGDRRRHGRGR